MLRYAIPITVFVLLVVVLGVGLTRDPKLVPSPLINKPLPAFTLTTLADAGREITAPQLKGQAYLLNVWASWCVACRQEHPLLLDLAKQNVLPIIGLNYKDERQAASEWLQQRGDPYRYSLFDDAGRLGLDLGVYGVPETFVVDAGGVIRFKHVGPLNAAVVQTELQPILLKLKGSGS